jgi:aspartate/tyrosine/aromatic aminotransferase
MSHFESVARLPRLEKYLFLEAYAADPRPHKLLASVGSYKNENGTIPKFECVQIATERMQVKNLTKSYLDVAGYVPFREAVTQFVFGAVPTLPERVETVHTPGGTVALRIGAEFIKTQWPQATIWVSDPTWGNHIKVFETAGLRVEKYSYFDAVKREFHIEKLLAEIEKIPDGDVIFLQAAPHNPTCLDPSPEEWHQIAAVVARKNLLPFFDVAFFGFSNGLSEDLAGFLTCCEQCDNILVAFSFSKSFALYNDRVGAFSVVGSSAEAAQTVYGHIRHIVRANYSNPPLDGAAVVTEILTDPTLIKIWSEELAHIRARIHSNREKLLAGFQAAGVQRDLSYLQREKGQFTTLDISLENIAALREKEAIYIAKTRRINVSALLDDQIERFCNLVGPMLGDIV